MDDYNPATLSEARNEYSIRLINILSPLVIEGLKSIYQEAWELCLSNDEKDKYLMTFQNFLTRVPKWNQDIIEGETKRVLSKSGCTYLEDLLACVHITQLKILTSIRVATKQKKIDIAVHSLKDMPSVLQEDFTLSAFLKRDDPRMSGYLRILMTCLILTGILSWGQAV